MPARLGWSTGVIRCCPSHPRCMPRESRRAGTAPSPRSERSGSSPNGANAIPSRVDAWLDARAADEATLAAVVESIRDCGRALCQGRPRHRRLRSRVDHPDRRFPRRAAPAGAGCAVAVRRGSRPSHRSGPRRRNPLGKGADSDVVRAQPHRGFPFPRGVRGDRRLPHRRGSAGRRDGRLGVAVTDGTFWCENAWLDGEVVASVRSASTPGGSPRSRRTCRRRRRPGGCAVW